MHSDHVLEVRCFLFCNPGSLIYAVVGRYHPHFHGLVDNAMLGGASGLIIIQGLEQVSLYPIFRMRTRVLASTDSFDRQPNKYIRHILPDFDRVIVLFGVGLQVRPEVAGLPTRTLAIRDQVLPAGSNTDDVNGPGFDVTVNFIPVPYPAYRMAKLEIGAGSLEFWRVINAGAETILELQVLIALEHVCIRKAATQFRDSHNHISAR